MKTKQKIAFILIAFILHYLAIFPATIFSQTIPEQIHIPSSDAGAIIGDIVEANEYLFAYSLDKLLVYDPVDNNLIASIPFPYTNDEHYGKFNPLYFNELYNVPAANIMAYNPNANVLYVVTPELSIIVIDVSDSNFDIISTYTPPTSDIPDYFKPLNGMNLIKFDHIHNRIYWVVTAKDINSTNNCTGQFHSVIRFFGIYKTDNSTGSITRYYVDLPLVTSDDYEVASIFDIAFNYENDLFYLAHMSLLKIYEVTENGSEEVELVSEMPIDPALYDADHYKFGKLIYINETYEINIQLHQIHKIVALPYRLLTYPINNSDIYIIDGDEASAEAGSWTTMPSPSKRVMDGIFHTNTRELILSYSPNPDDILPTPTPGVELDDIAVYEYDFNTGTFIYDPNPQNNQPQRIITDHSQNYSNLYDYNYSSNLLQLDASNTLISKKDEIILLKNTNNYSVTPLLPAENNIFSKSVKVDYTEGDPPTQKTKWFTINGTSNGLEIINISDNNFNVNSIKCGYAVNHIVSDVSGEKFYFFNKQNTFNTGCYIYDNENQSLYNINSPLDTKIEAPIGDCIYNPYLDHFIVSENAQFTDYAAQVLVFNNDQSNTHLISRELVYEDENQTEQDAYYATKMYIGPDEKLYVFANMRYTDDSNPVIFVLNATDNELGAAYDILYSHEVTDFPVSSGSTTYQSVFDFYNGYFCYFPDYESVYATISPNEFIYTPYSPVPNTLYGFQEPFEDACGLLIKISEAELSTYPMNYPGKIICPDNEIGPGASQYNGKMFIIGTNLSYYSSVTDAITSPGDENGTFNDIAYSPKHDMLFGLRNAEGSCGAHRKIQIYTISISGDDITYEMIAEVEGQATCLFYNTIDGLIYFQQKYDAEKLGSVPVKLWSIDYNTSQGNILSSTDLGFTSVYPDANHDGDKRLFLYNITTPHINPYNNTIYLPNGGHSCVSKVSFNADEAVLLNEGTWAWMSFPRLDTDGGDPSVHEVLYGPNTDRIDPMPYNQNSEIRNIVIGSYPLITNLFDGVEWPITGQGLVNVNNIAGYKLKLLYDDPPSQKWLFLSGDLIHPNDTAVTLSGGGANPKENWLGYYLPITQSPFDAIDDEIEPDLSIIKAQNWVCYNDNPVGDNALWRCACNKGNLELKYGDMVILKTNDGIDVPGFQWQFFGNPISDFDRQESEYYQYTETADYTPIFIELDTTENPVEIGAFVEDSCVGATTVMPDDSLLLISAYTEGLSGEVYFEKYYGTQKSTQPPISEYYVTTPKLKFAQKRLIHTNEQQDYYVVSFKNQDNKNDFNLDENLWLNCIPNPVRSQSVISCNIPVKAFTEIILYDMTGTQINVIHEGILNAGSHEFSLSGNELPSTHGMYLLSLKTTSGSKQLKIIIMK